MTDDRSDDPDPDDPGAAPLLLTPAHLVTDGPQAEPSAESPQVPDEATLRRIVSEVLREELRGPIGERITFNVRELVRREVRAALKSRGT